MIKELFAKVAVATPEQFPLEEVRDSLYTVRHRKNETNVWYLVDQEQEYHKYIHLFAQLPDSSGINRTEEWWIAGPLEEFPLHRDLQSFFCEQFHAEEPYCPGGGYLEVVYRAGHIRPAALNPFGRSTQFGTADHQKAAAAFNF